jgi:hypothetical protein
MRPCLEKTLHKNRASGMAQGIGLEFKPQYCKEKKKMHASKLVTIIILKVKKFRIH